MARLGPFMDPMVGVMLLSNDSWAHAASSTGRWPQALLSLLLCLRPLGGQVDNGGLSSRVGGICEQRQWSNGVGVVAVILLVVPWCFMQL